MIIDDTRFVYDMIVFEYKILMNRVRVGLGRIYGFLGSDLL